MNDKFFPGLARRLKREGIATLPVEKACLPVLAGGEGSHVGPVLGRGDLQRRSCE